MNNTDWPSDLDLFAFFAGKTSAYGFFEDRFGNTRRLFTVKILGEVEGDHLTLSEDFIYDDGVMETRTWLITRDNNSAYSGVARDVVGKALGLSQNAKFNWRYSLLLKIGSKQHKVKFDDWMYLMPNDVLLNRAVVTKFGIKLGTVFISFVKP